MKINFSPPDIGEEEIRELVDTLRSGWITTGPKTKEFERQIAKLCHTQKAVCLNSATAALELTLRLCGIGKGDEVITTAYTYSATCSVICHVGAKPVLVDTIEGTYFMDPDKAEAAINERTKAILCVDLAGRIYPYYERLFEMVESKRSIYRPAADMQELYKRILIISDAAHALGASLEGEMCGSIADFTCFSFHAVKNLTTAEGGAVTWKELPREGISDEHIYKKFMLLSLHGQSKDALEKSVKGSWEYDIVAPYYKCNMTDIAASIGLAQLRRYDSMLKKRRRLIEAYDEVFYRENISHALDIFSHYDKGSISSGHLYMVRLKGKNREFCNRLISYMADRDISLNVHYKPLPLLSAYKNLGFAIEDYPNAYRQFESEITLPVYTTMTDEEQAYVTENFVNYIKKSLR